MWSAQKSHGAKIPLENTYPVNVKAVSCLIKYIINNSCGAGKIPSNNHETTQFILLKSVIITKNQINLLQPLKNYLDTKFQPSLTFRNREKRIKIKQS